MAAAGGAPHGALGGAAAAGGPPPPANAAALLAMVQGLPDAAGSEVARLAQQQKDLQTQRRLVQKDLKNAKAKQKRVIEKARTLSDAQLLMVVASRAAAKAKAKAKAKG